MTVDLVGSGGVSGNLNIFTTVLPAGTQQDDILALFVAHSTQTIDSITPAVTLVQTITEGGLLVDIFYRKLTAANASANLVVDMTGTVLSKASVVWSVQRGVDPDNPMPSGCYVVAQGNDTARSSPALTFSGDARNVLAYISERANGTTTGYVPPAGLTELQDRVTTGSASQSSALGVVEDVAAGTVGPYAWTTQGSLVVARRIGITMALPPIAAPADLPLETYIDPDGVERNINSIQWVDPTGTLRTLSRDELA